MFGPKRRSLIDAMKPVAKTRVISVSTSAIVPPRIAHGQWRSNRTTGRARRGLFTLRSTTVLRERHVLGLERLHRIDAEHRPDGASVDASVVRIACAQVALHGDALGAGLQL